MDDEKVFIICGRCTRPGPRVPDSTIRECVKCHELVDVSPTSVAFLEKNPDTLIMCLECAIEIATKDGEKVEIVGEVPK